MSKLNAMRLRTLTKPGTYGDGSGLYLQVRMPGKPQQPEGPDKRERPNRSWLYRFKLHGKAHLMGLGTVDDVSLAEARDVAAAARKLVRQGINPIDQRRAARAESAAQAGLTFAQVAGAYIAAHERSWRNVKHRQQWRNTLDTYANPILGKLPVAQVDVGAVMRVLEPLWGAKTETASRLRGRIEAVLDYATARGWRSGDNPARWRGHLDNLLPAPSKIAKVEHHAALPWREIGTFMATLAKEEGVSALALRFTILTAARTGEVIGARWTEIDMQAATWTVPPSRMKAAREHRVPLSDPAMKLLRAKLRTSAKADGFVFPGGKAGKPLSSMALLMLLRRMERGDLTAHGFRSTFRDWCAEATNYPREVAEAALAHTLHDKTEAAYQRGDLMEKRRRLMGDWASYCSRPPVTGEVVTLRAGA
ncbi:MAG TPA: integrase arm-type DNA-binding domain-containing protein [Acetobacteraceae bacterium]|nr:integrase arm-type DNA-binding domain-containing protein [Acetobacteraceae bacterium]